MELGKENPRKRKDSEKRFKENADKLLKKKKSRYDVVVDEMESINKEMESLKADESTAETEEQYLALKNEKDVLEKELENKDKYAIYPKTPYDLYIREKEYLAD